MITLEAGVSPSTVSRILNGSAPVSAFKRDAVERVLTTRQFQPNALARGLVRGKTLTIGVLTQDIGSPFYGEILRGIEDVLAKTDYFSLIVSGHGNQKDEIAGMALLEARRVDGVIVLNGRLTDEQLLAYSEHLPVVATGRGCTFRNLFSLSIDQFHGAYLAVQHLIELGHTRIAYISGPEDNLDSTQRMRGYQKALMDNSLMYDSNLVVHADFRASGGTLAIHQLLTARRGFTAIFAANDQMAYGASLALYRLNIRVPEDISIVGFDDLPSSEFTMPPLTTVRQPVYQIGELAGKAVLGLIEHQPIQVQPLALNLIVRETTRRIRP